VELGPRQLTSFDLHSPSCVIGTVKKEVTESRKYISDGETRDTCTILVGNVLEEEL
jgi:hypothetical protein